MYHKTLEEFTMASASREPVPGGGGVSAAAGALAASLAEMVTNLTIGKKHYARYREELEEIRQTAESLRIRLLENINDDAEAFQPLSRVYAMDHDDPEYEARMEQCLRDAAKPPFMIMKSCCDVIEIDERLAVIGSRLAVSDAATSVMLAHGALYGGYINVIVNTRLMKDREYASQLEEDARALLNEYQGRALNCFQAVEKRLSNG